MNLNDLESILVSLTQDSYIETLDSLKEDLNNLSNQKNMGLLSSIKELEELINLLTQVDGSKRKIIIEKIKLFIKNDTTIIPFSNGAFSPPLLKMDVVHCNFTGVGFEWDGPHYAVVWDVNPQFDSVMVIPTTSKSRIEQANVFSVGSVNGLPKGDTTLLVSDMTRVSRKRLARVPFYHPKKGDSFARLPMVWIKKINEAIAVSYTNENTFEQLLTNNCGVAMVNDLNILYSLRYKPVRGEYNEDTSLLNYSLWNEDEKHSIELIKPKKVMIKSTKIRMIKGLFSVDKDTQEHWQSRYEEYYE